MLRVDLGPVTVVRKTTKGQVRHCLREQRKVPGSLLEGAKIAIFLERKKRALIKKC